MNSDQNKKILLAHGGGGRLSSKLIENSILPKLRNDTLAELGDSASLDLDSASVCFTTDSFVVKPLFFNGGDIGKLAVCGTVNDLAVAGAKPVALSLSLIVEEGLEIEVFEKILSSAAEAAKGASVDIVTGDTKVVEQGAADKIFINTAGIGTRYPGVDLSMSKIKPGDKVIINGNIGDHGMAIMSQREGISFDSPLQSDCACLGGIIGEVLENCDGVRFMRDPTRGGVAATLNEIAEGSGHGIELVESALPIDPTVRAAADMLGFDLLETANEGKVLFIVDAGCAEKVVEICRAHRLGKNAGVIGTVIETEDDPVVEIVTSIRGRRIVQKPYGRELPRIC